jgi:hypothetical protein
LTVCYIITENNIFNDKIFSVNNMAWECNKLRPKHDSLLNGMVFRKVITLEIFSRIAEGRIKEAIRNGGFENLPGQGKPLRLDDLSTVTSLMLLAASSL